MTTLETLCHHLAKDLANLNPGAQSLDTYRDAMGMVAVTTWSHPELPPLILEGSRGETFEEAVVAFGEENDHLLKGKESVMQNWKLKDLPEWSP